MKASTVGTAQGFRQGRLSIEVFGGTGSGVHQGQEHHSNCRNYDGQQKNFTGQHFWARGYYVSTAAKDEALVRDYIKRQEEEDRLIEQVAMF